MDSMCRIVNLKGLPLFENTNAGMPVLLQEVEGVPFDRWIGESRGETPQSTQNAG